MAFDGMKLGPPDPMYSLKVEADGDLSADKIDLGVGVYRNEQGQYHELKVLSEVRFSLYLKIRSLSLITSPNQAKDALASINPGHDVSSGDIVSPSETGRLMLIISTVWSNYWISRLLNAEPLRHLRREFGSSQQ